MSDTAMSYYSRHKPCNGVVTVVVDDPIAGAKYLARVVAKMMRDDPPVRRASVDRVRAMKWCECWRKKVKR